MPPPAVLRLALNCAGTVIVYFASFWFRPVHDQLFLALLRHLTVTLAPSWANSTGFAFRNSSSAVLFLRPILRQTSTTTSLLALVLTLMLVTIRQVARLVVVVGGDAVGACRE